MLVLLEIGPPETQAEVGFHRVTVAE